MEWPLRRFTKAFDAFRRRTACDEWRARKIAHLAALHANTNLDDEKNDKGAISQKLERSYDNIIARIWNGTINDPDEDGVDEAEWESDFMRAGRKHTATQLQPPLMPGEAQIGALPGR